MIRNYLVIARVSIDFNGYYGATEDYILGHSQSKMIADSYAATLTRELELYKTREVTSEIITDYRFLWAKEIIDTPTYVFYKNADEITVSFVVVETESIDTELNDVEVCKEENDECGSRFTEPKLVYVVTQTLEYQDFETHYETKVLEVFSTKEAAQAFIDSKPEIGDTHIEMFVKYFYGEVYYDIREMEVK